MAVIIQYRWGPMIDVDRSERSLIEQAAQLAHPMFVQNDWKYGWNEPHVPAVDELTDCIVRLWQTVKTSPIPEAYAASGRFKVQRVNGTIQILCDDGAE